MSDIEMEIKKAIKPYEDISDKMVHCLEEYLEDGVENADTKEVYDVVDIIKDLAEAKHYIVDSMYKIKITEAMEENEANAHGGNRWKNNFLEAKMMYPANDERVMKALNDYMQAISEDVTEMLHKMSQNEKDMMRQKMQAMIQNIA